MGKMYCVYIHKNKINGKIYVGLTSSHPPTKRWKNGKGYEEQPHFYRAIQKYGWNNFEHIVVKDNLTAEQASVLEDNLINLYNTLDSNFGYNKRHGGIEEYKLTEEQRKKCGDWARGRKYSEQHRKNISKGLKNRVFSNEAKEKMSKAKIKAQTFQGKNNPKAQKVICVETNQVFDTIKEAAIFVKGTSDGISKACRGIQKTSAGYHWKYYNKNK